MRRLARIAAIAVVTSVTLFATQPASVTAQRETRAIFGLPFAEPPGPDTWLLGQVYGNTTGAFAQRRTWYRAGQGIHFGIDFSARCGTPVVAIGDGVVLKVDAREHGSAPHNLLIAHPNGYVSLYGHLLERPMLRVGQRVRRGEVIGLTGDPDLTLYLAPTSTPGDPRPHAKPRLQSASSD